MSERCFVVCPFGEPFDEYYKEIYRPAIVDAGLVSLRADEVFSPGIFMRDVVNGILTSAIVLADLTGRNANVFYEVGLAHAYGKPVIMVTQEKDAVPSDLQGLRWIGYGTRSVHWGESLRTSIKDTILTCIKATAVERSRLFVPPAMETGDSRVGIADQIVGLSPTQRRIFDLLRSREKPMSQRELQGYFPEQSGGEMFYRLETLRLQGLLNSSVVGGSGTQNPEYSYFLSDSASTYSRRNLRPGAPTPNLAGEG
jgi:hypothetical protein